MYDRYSVITCSERTTWSALVSSFEPLHAECCPLSCTQYLTASPTSTFILGASPVHTHGPSNLFLVRYHSPGPNQPWGAGCRWLHVSLSVSRKKYHIAYSPANWLIGREAVITLLEGRKPGKKRQDRVVPCYRCNTRCLATGRADRPHARAQRVAKPH
jgi:hypothetical protein